MSSGYPYLCCAENSQLVVIDIQEKLGHAMPNKVLNRVVLNTLLVIRSANLFEIPCLLTEQYPQGLGRTDENLKIALQNARYFEKTNFNATAADGFLSTLAQAERKQVVLVGMEAHVCILQTALALQHEGYHVFVVEDAICSRRLENYQNALDRLRQTGVQIVTAESVVFEWLGDAKHEHFKEIQKTLR